MRIKPALIIKTLKYNDLDVTKTAEELGIHRSTVYRWKNIASTPSRYSTHLRVTNLSRKSTRPHKVYTALTHQQELDIIVLRRSKNLTAVKIKHVLGLDVGINTIHRLLKRKNLTSNYGNHTRPRYQKTKHMYLENTKTVGYLQMDVKYVTPELSGLPWTCYEYAVIDILGIKM
jgi:transposase